jgi:hypothetical protein
MVTATTQRKRPAKLGKRHKGIVADAAELSVTRQHLFAVLTKRRSSPTLMARYRALPSQQPAKPEAAKS